MMISPISRKRLQPLAAAPLAGVATFGYFIERKTRRAGHSRIDSDEDYTTICGNMHPSGAGVVVSVVGYGFDICRFWFVSPLQGYGLGDALRACVWVPAFAGMTRGARVFGFPPARE